MSDGCGIRLMLRGPAMTSDKALTSIWRHVSAEPGLPPAMPYA
ncbi:hypothetical protein RKE30_19880 [Streptomyces sp. Li-HN-5-11]|nr:hypothetical protein [Streptomyces sp. Li-HN-5-11]WNM32513.1 hypothetical protein RKE30_19880 [Streptomyces sp. Li-HN-5-11]WOP38737.1 hypothetical protein RKE32_35755 [Streptomyces sp. Li-HN-5-13]